MKPGRLYKALTLKLGLINPNNPNEKTRFLKINEIAMCVDCDVIEELTCVNLLKLKDLEIIQIVYNTKNEDLNFEELTKT